MLVFPLKWLPYFMIIGGIGCLFASEGEDVIWGIVLIIAGGFWLYKRYSNKKGNNNDIPIEQTDATNYQKNENNSTVGFCINCGSKLVEGASFCSECGKKI